MVTQCDDDATVCVTLCLSLSLSLPPSIPPPLSQAPSSWAASLLVPLCSFVFFVRVSPHFLCLLLVMLRQPAIPRPATRLPKPKLSARALFAVCVGREVRCCELLVGAN